MAVSPSLARGLIAPWFRVVDRNPSVERVHPRIHWTTDYDRFAVIAAIKIIRSSLTINSKLKLLRSRGPRDNVLASLTSTTDTSWSLRAWANYSHHSPLRNSKSNPRQSYRSPPPSREGTSARTCTEKNTFYLALYYWILQQRNSKKNRTNCSTSRLIDVKLVNFLAPIVICLTSYNLFH